jgi:hypothetical protein
MTTLKAGSRPDEQSAAGGAGEPSKALVSQHSVERGRARIKRWLTKPDDALTGLWILLLITLFVEGMGSAALAFGQLHAGKDSDQQFFAAMGVGILAVIGVVNGWALFSVLAAGRRALAADRHAAAPWARVALIAQLLILFLAAYILWVDYSLSPKPSALVKWVAATASIVSVAWVLLLLGRAALEWKSAAILGALVPLVASSQFWLQNFYVPQSTAPLVDFTAELMPQGSTPRTNTGLKTHLSAKVTVHNRGAGRVIVAGALMRITTYADAPRPPQCATRDDKTRDDKVYDRACLMALGENLDISGNNYDKDFRANPTPATNTQLIYAGLLQPGPNYGLSPGDTQYFQRAIEIDSTARLTRLSVSGIFLTQRTIRDTRSCQDQDDHLAIAEPGKTPGGDLDPPAATNATPQGQNPPASLTSDPKRFGKEVRTRYSVPNKGQEVLCKEYEFAHTNILEKLIGNRTAIRVSVILKDTNAPDLEHPQLQIEYGLIERNKLRVDQSLGQKIAIRNPGVVYRDVSAEYVYEEKPPV